MVMCFIAVALACFALSLGAAYMASQLRTAERHIRGVASALLSENSERREQMQLLQTRLDDLEDFLGLDELLPKRNGDGLMVLSPSPGGRRGYRRPN